MNMNEESGEGSARRIQVRFVTKLGAPYKVPTTAIAIPADLDRFRLSSLVNALRQPNDADYQPEPFDFLIDGEFVRMSLEQFLLAKGISAERILEIEYTRAVAPRKEEDPSLHDDWVSAVDGSSSRFFLTGCYDGLGRVWKGAGLCTHILEGHSDAITSVSIINPKGPVLSISGTPTITSEKLNGKNYLSWSAFVELWFLGQGYHDHLEKESDAVPTEARAQWKKLDYQLCAVLWQSVEPDILVILRTSKTCCSFWKRAKNIFANDIQRLYDLAQKLVSLKQVDHDMVSYVAQAQSVVKELKLFLEADSLEEIKRRHDKLCMVLILRGMHSDFDHIRDQILTGQELPSMESLLTRLRHVPTLKKDESSLEHAESSIMVSTRGRGGRGNHGGRGGRGGRPQCSYCRRMGHTLDTCYSLHGFPKRTTNVSKIEKSEHKFSEEEYQEYLRLKSNSQAQSSSITSISTTCISQSVDSQGPWIIDSSAFDHISGMWYGSTDWHRI